MLTDHPGIWACIGCSYVALYQHAQNVHQQNTGHSMIEYK